MKNTLTLTGFFISIILFSGCKKDNKSPGSPGNNSKTYFFENTEWTGVAATYGQTYSQPCYLRFNGDSTVSVYVLFVWMENNNLVDVDSVVGKITDIDTVTNGMTTIQVNFPRTSDQQVYYITDKNSLRGGPGATTGAIINNQFSPQLQLCPPVIPSVKGTSWSTNKMVGGPTDGMYEYPDLSTFSFNADNTTTYIRNGKIITYTPPDQTQLILEEYNQTGPKLYFAGYNEEKDVLIGYFGVLSADGQTILADTHARQDARLPYYFQTIFWYGPAGVTPNIHKLN